MDKAGGMSGGGPMPSSICATGCKLCSPQNLDHSGVALDIDGLNISARLDQNATLDRGIDDRPPCVRMMGDNASFQTPPPDDLSGNNAPGRQRPDVGVSGLGPSRWCIPDDPPHALVTCLAGSQHQHNLERDFVIGPGRLRRRCTICPLGPARRCTSRRGSRRASVVRRPRSP